MLLVEKENERLSFASAVGLDNTVVSRPGPKLGEGVAGWVALHGDPVLITGEIGETEGFKAVEARDRALDVAISIPLQLDDEIIAVLNLGATAAGGKDVFSDDDLRFGYLFAQHAALAIARAKLAEDRERLRVLIGG